MKKMKLLLIIMVSGVLFSSCSIIIDDTLDNTITLEELMSSYDLWYVDIHRTSGNGDIPFMSMAFTLSFLNGTMYANNNIVDIGYTGDGFGIPVGSYNTYGGFLETFHEIDGRYNFEVVQLSLNEIRVYDTFQNLSYVLVGYQRNNFDYDMLFYDNIEYFLQEYNAWEQTAISSTGMINPFDDEHYLQFASQINPIFFSSLDSVGLDIDQLIWDFSGNYEIYDVIGYQDLKILTLNYDIGYTKEFELRVLNDQRIELFHLDSQTTYEFSGRGFIQLLRGGTDTTQPSTQAQGRKRSKIIRKKKKKNLK